MLIHLDNDDMFSLQSAGYFEPILGLFNRLNKNLANVMIKKFIIFYEHWDRVVYFLPEDFKNDFAVLQRKVFVAESVTRDYLIDAVNQVSSVVFVTLTVILITSKQSKNIVLNISIIHFEFQ